LSVRAHHDAPTIRIDENIMSNTPAKTPTDTSAASRPGLKTLIAAILIIAAIAALIYFTPPA